MPTLSQIRAATVAANEPVWVRDIAFDDTGLKIDLRIRSAKCRIAADARDAALAAGKDQAATLDAMFVAMLADWSITGDDGQPVPCTSEAIAEWLGDPDLGDGFRRTVALASGRVKGGKLVEPPPG